MCLSRMYVWLEYNSYWSLISNILASTCTATAKFKGGFVTCFINVV